MDPDQWFSTRRLAIAQLLREIPENFIPIKGEDQDEARRRRTEAAERRLDRDAVVQ